MSFKLTIKERASRHMMEREPRYDVLVNDKKVDELYFNMTGYQGGLMNISGTRVGLGERGISAYKKEAGRINREAKDVLAANTADKTRIDTCERTRLGDIRRLTFDDGRIMCVDNRAYMAAVELMGANRVGPAFFDEEEELFAMAPGATLRTGDNWEDTRFVLSAFETSDPEQVALAIGTVPKPAADLISYAKTGILPDDWHQTVSVDAVKDRNGSRVLPLPSDWNLYDLKERFSEDWGDGITGYVFIGRMEFEAIAAANGGEFIRSDHLPGSGIMSQSPEVFAQTITTNTQRPDILMDMEDIKLFDNSARMAGYDVNLKSAEIEEVPEP
jgi:hypothetical protein